MVVKKNVREAVRRAACRECLACVTLVNLTSCETAFSIRQSARIRHSHTLLITPLPVSRSFGFYPGLHTVNTLNSNATLYYKMCTKDVQKYVIETVGDRTWSSSFGKTFHAQCCSILRTVYDAKYIQVFSSLICNIARFDSRTIYTCLFFNFSLLPYHTM